MRTRFIIIIGFFILALPGVSTAQRYQRVRIESPTREQAALAVSLDDDHARRITAVGLECVLSEPAVEQLRTAGCRITVLIPDLAGYYRERAHADLARMRTDPAHRFSKPAAAANFALGSVGGFLNMGEYETQLGLMLDKFPKLMATPFSIGTTLQGRPIYAVRISALPESDKNAPEVLLTAMHHAREPGGMMSLMYTMWHLMEGYGTDPEATYLLNNRVIWFIPMVNPDGYARNVANDPQGGGMWRKNMRDNGENAVDINRNYGPQDFWDNPAGGSSLDPRSDSYRGTEPFSEPETKAMRDFCLAHHFRVVLNHHTYSNLLIYPFDWKLRTPPDSTFYRVVTPELAGTAGYAPGVAAEAVGYIVRGDADSWMYSYGVPGKTTVVWTPESGSDYDGFWPEPSRIVPMAEADNAMNLLTVWIAASVPRITSVVRADDSSGNPVLRLRVTNLGRGPMDGAATVKIDAPGAVAAAIPELLSAQTVTMDLPVPPSVSSGTKARPELSIITTYHNVPLVRRVRLPVHALTVRFDDDFDGALPANWSLGQWGAETVRGRGNVLSDSPGKDYTESSTASIVEMIHPVSLRIPGVDAAELTFDASYVVQAHDHYISVEAVRADSGDWEPLDCPQFQVPIDTTGTSRIRLRGNLGSWTRYSVSLDKYLGSNIYLRFRFSAEGSQYGYTFNGLLVDSMRIATSAAGITGVQSGADETGLPPITACPNPFSDQLEVRLEGAGDRAVISLADLLGRTVRRTSGTHAVFSAADLPAGFYTVTVTENGRTGRKSVLLRR